MDKEKYMVFDGDSHDYDIVVEKLKNSTTYSLYYSPNEIWKDGWRGELILTLTDTGNEYKLSKSFGKKLEVDEIVYLRLLLNIQQSLDLNLSNRIGYRVIKDETFIIS